MQRANPGRTGGVGTVLRPYWRSMSVSLLLLTAVQAAEGAVPWVLGSAIDAYRDGDLAAVRLLAGIAIACGVAFFLLQAGSRAQVTNLSRDVECDLRFELLRSVHRLGVPVLNEIGAGQVLSRSTDDLAQVRMFVQVLWLGLFRSVLAAALTVALMLALSPELTLYTLLLYPAVGVLFAFLFRPLLRQNRAQQDAQGELVELVQRSIEGVRVVRAYNLQRTAATRFDAANATLLRHSVRLAVTLGAVILGPRSIPAFALLIVLYRGGVLVIDGELTVGALVAMSAYVGLMTTPALSLGRIVAQLQRARSAFSRVQEVLTREPDVRPPLRPRSPRGAGAVRAEGLTYVRDGQRVLDGVSFEVPAGGALAVVGTSGSGKSTLAELLARLLPTPPGSVFLDGDDVTELDLQELRRAVAISTQEPFLFSSTVAQNITFSLGAPEREGAPERIRAAAEEAAVLDEIEHLPAGFDTQVGEKGVLLSGGQRLRVALARTIAGRPPVLVLDDPLSGVDAETELRILDAIDRVRKGRTLILITHRVAAAARMDDVVVLDGGRVVERGRHEDLLQTGGLYSRLAGLQRRRSEEAAAR